MADYAPNVTARYKVHYRNAGAEHVCQVRQLRGEARNDEGYLTKLNNIFAAVSSSRFSDFAFLSAEWLPQDTEDSLPADTSFLTSVGGSQSIADAKPIHKGLQTRFVGRSETGSPVSLTIFGLNFDNFVSVGYLQDFRIVRGEVSTIDDALDFLTETAPIFHAVNGAITLWKPYVNIKVNDSWLGTIRNG